MAKTIIGILSAVFIFSLSQVSCVHEPVPPGPINPIDTMMVDTMQVDTILLGPCDTNKIYFEFEILPILNTSCAISSCHDVTTMAGNIVLSSFDSLNKTTLLTPFNLNETQIFSALISTDPDAKMPPASAAPLPSEDLEKIASWILQGADNESCDPTFGCDTTMISFTNLIFPILQNNCIGCHSGQSPGGGIDLSNYTGVKNITDNGSLIGSIKWRDGFEPMPQGMEQLSACDIKQIELWIQDGAMNN